MGRVCMGFSDFELYCVIWFILYYILLLWDWNQCWNIKLSELQFRVFCIHNHCSNLHLCVNFQPLQRSSGNPISILFVSSFVCLPALQIEFGMMGIVQYWCLINYVWRCRYKCVISATPFSWAGVMLIDTSSVQDQIDLHIFLFMLKNIGWISQVSVNKPL